MRRGFFTIQRRSITGIAPTLFIPKVKPDAARDTQIEKNTKAALEMMRILKGQKPTPYTRKYKATLHELTDEIEALLGTAAKLRRNSKDSEPMDKIGAMERSLRHALWSYLKDEGDTNFAEMEKWLVYTALDQQRLTSLRQESEKKDKYKNFLEKRADATTECSTPQCDVVKEYANAVDREALVEKRLRYNTLSITTMRRNDSAVEAESVLYRRPVQEQRLDRICDLLEKFKPILAREAILQRLTVKHLEGKLGLWRYLDWNPEVRDRAEIEADHYSQQWWYTNEEKRLSQIRLRSKNELNEIAEKNQNKAEANNNNKSSSSASSGDAVALAREKLLQEIIRLQSRVGHKGGDGEDDKAVSSEESLKLAAASAAEEKAVKVAEEVVQEIGLLGLDFIGTGSAKASATASSS